MRLEERWSQPLPQWTETIKEEVEKKLERSRFIQECQAGNNTVIQNMFKRLWPLVKEYPALIESGAKNAKWYLFKRLELRSWWDFRTTGMTMLDMMRRAEEEYGAMWIQNAKAVGVELTGFMFGTARPEVKKIIDALGKTPHPSVFFFRAAAIEILAHAVSVHLLESDKFKDALKSEGHKWFETHAYLHKGITHEALMYYLGFWFLKKELLQNDVNVIVQDMVDLFILSAEGTVSIR